MGTMRTPAAAMACLAMAVLISGCTTADPEPTATPTATPTASPSPVFASDEEALAAAENAYDDYLAMSDLIAQEGGANPERLGGLVTDEFLDSEIKGFVEFGERGVKQIGESKADTFRIQAADLQVNTFQFSVYLCLDVSRTDVVDHSGKSVVPSDRAERLPMQVNFELNEDRASLLVEEPVIWDGTDFCA